MMRFCFRTKIGRGVWKQKDSTHIGSEIWRVIIQATGTRGAISAGLTFVKTALAGHTALEESRRGSGQAVGLDLLIFSLLLLQEYYEISAYS